jgi:peroxiredoxin
MKRFAFLAALGMAASIVPSQALAAEALTGPQLGSPAPPFSLRTIDGRTVSLDQYRGKTLVINVWATWCPPCRQEMADLIASYPDLEKAGVEFLGVDTTERAPIVRAYVVAKGVPYGQAIDSDESFSKAYDIQYFPTTFVVDPSGIVRARYIDVISSHLLAQMTSAAQEGKNTEITSQLQAKIDALLADPALRPSGDSAAIVAAATKASAAIDKAEDMLGDSDAAKGNATDLLRTRSEEAALRDSAIEALTPVAQSDNDKILLDELKGDAARDREQYAGALDAYRAVLDIDPKNTSAWEGVAFVSARLEHHDDEIAAERKLVALQPDKVEPLVDLGLTYGKVSRFDEAYATFEQAVVLAKRHVDAKPGAAALVRRLAWVHLYFGRTYAKGGEPAKARVQFEQLMAWTQKLPANDERHDMYLEEGQEAIVALGLSAPSSVASVSLAPWTGAELPGSIPNTIKYRLIVAGASGKNVALRAAGVPKGWVASFCSDRVCAPFRVSVAIPESGVKVIEFQLVPPTAKAAPGKKVRVIESDGTHSSIATT